MIVKDNAEPLYGSIYLPRKFKIGVTVPGDNSMDLYINDIGTSYKYCISVLVIVPVRS